MDRKNQKYIISKNNYGGIVFFLMVVVSLIYIINYDKKEIKSLSDDSPVKSIISDKDIILEPTNEILELMKYPNLGDNNIFKIYQSMYLPDYEVKVEDLSDETMLYIAYKYLESDYNDYNKYLTCDIARRLGIDKNIIECGGSYNHVSYYTINNSITKELLNQTVFKLFNRKISRFTNFYTNDDNVCYFIDNDYICIRHKYEDNNERAEVTFVKAFRDRSYLDIVVSYKHVRDGIYYDGFNSMNVGEGKYISRFERVNGQYHWISTKYYEES